jgi:hypothetical protein
LLAVRPLIYDCLNLAVALLDRPRPGVEESCTEVIERYVSKVALIDANSREAATVSVCGMTRFELTRTGVVAVAIAELGALDVPINLCHGVRR